MKYITEDTIRVSLLILSMFCAMMYIVLYLLSMQEVKRLKKQRDFIVYCHLQLIISSSIDKEIYEVADTAKKLLDAMDYEDMEGLEMTIFKLNDKQK